MDRDWTTTNLIKPMTDHFLPPRGKDAAQLAASLKDYHDQLRGFDPETQGRAWKLILQTYEQKSWPAVKTMIEACKQSRPVYTQSNPVKEFTKEMAFDCPGGQLALAENIGFSYLDKAMPLGRCLSLPEVRALIALERRIEKNWRQHPDMEIRENAERRIANRRSSSDILKREYLKEKVA